MKRMTRICSLCCLLTVMFLAGCSVEEEDWRTPVKANAEGEIAVKLSFYTNTPQEIITRADDARMNTIDDVHILIFKESPITFDAEGKPVNESDTTGIVPGSKLTELNDGDSVVIRNYIKYGIEQLVFLKPKTSYRIFAVANISEFNVPDGNTTAYLDSVKTYGDLKKAFLTLAPSLVPPKLIMTTDGVIKVNLPERLTETGTTIKIPLCRALSRIELNIYNRVDPTSKANLSGVFPVSFTGLHIPMRTNLLPQDKDYAAIQVPDRESAANDSLFTQTQFYMLPEPEKSGNDTVLFTRTVNGQTYTYTKQTVMGYTFENRQPMVEAKKLAMDSLEKRRSLAPTYSTIAQITSATLDKVLLTYVLPGQGRESAGDDKANLNVPEEKSDSTDYSIERNCIYHLNVFINGTKDVLIDSRREYLDQLVVLMFPTNMNRVDAHYMDIPIFLTGKYGGVKLQAGLPELETNGSIKYDAMKAPIVKQLWNEKTADTWLNFSWRDPYQAGQAKPIHYANLGRANTAGDGLDAITGATPIMHFNEFVDDPVMTNYYKAPPQRHAVIRIGYVSDATSTTYEDLIKNDAGKENVFYVTVSQWGLRTVGQVGGYDPATDSYTSWLGVESEEEYRIEYYKNQPTIKGLPWNFAGVTAKTNYVSPYDGKLATETVYKAYWALLGTGGIPAKKGDKVGSQAIVYDPVYTTFAADYCMRKNRDEDGNGIIEGDEIKWYLPSAVQLMQISLWREELKYPFNLSYTPMDESYWAVNDLGDATAMALEATNVTTRVYVTDIIPKDKSLPRSIRCVRDIPNKDGGTATPMIFIKNGFLTGNLDGQLPVTVVRDKSGWTTDQIKELTNNQWMQTSLLISKRYIRANNGLILTGDGSQKNPCQTYGEGTYTSGWRLPTQRELSFLYAYSGMIEQLAVKNNLGESVFDKFILGYHWAITNDGNNGHFWGMNFATGGASLYQKKEADHGYYRCVRDIVHTSDQAKP